MGNGQKQVVLTIVSSLLLFLMMGALTEATPIAQWKMDDNAANATVLNSGSGGTALNGTLRTGSAESSLNTNNRHSSDSTIGAPSVFTTVVGTESGAC